MSTTHPLRRAKYLSMAAVYGLVSFALAGGLIGVIGEEHATAVIVGWTLSVFLAGRVLKSRIHSGT